MTLLDTANVVFVNGKSDFDIKIYLKNLLEIKKGKKNNVY